MPQDLLSELDAYFRLSWTFAGLVAALAVLLMLLYMRKRRAEKRGEQNAEVSLSVIQGQEEERRRVAGELHDAILPELQRLAQALRSEDGEIALERQRAVSGAIRELCTRLLPPDFERLSFKDALLVLCASFSERAKGRQSAPLGVCCASHVKPQKIADQAIFYPANSESSPDNRDFCVIGGAKIHKCNRLLEFHAAIDDNLDLGELGPGSCLAIYRIVQEALTNCEKYARGPVVLVVRNSAATGAGGGATGGGKTLLICVSDHGPGLDPALAAGSPGKGGSPGLGLRIMRLRAAALGASLDFICEEGNGLMVRLETPVIPPPPPIRP